MCLLPFCTGCRDEMQDRTIRMFGKKAAATPPAAAPLAPPAAEEPEADSVLTGLNPTGTISPRSPASQSTAAQGAAGEPGKKDGPAQAEITKAKKSAPVERKIKYTANLQLICDEFAKAEEGLQAAIKEFKGRIAHSELTTSPGAPRSGTWRIRVPVAEFEGFRDAVRKLGEVERNTSDSEDVTELYYDLENHIKNKLAEEESLRKLLEKSANEKIENVLAVRRELAEVRDDINRKQGKLNLLANLTDLTTVTVTLRERQKYDPAPPPAIAESASFGTRIGVTFANSWDAFVAALQFVVIAATAAAPWLALPAVVALAGWVVLRRRHRAPPVTPQVTPSAPPSG
jgi:hypothetical protein